MTYASDLDRVMRMARKEYTSGPISVADMHPSLRFTRLGAHLRAAGNSGHNDDISSLARAALLSDHEQSLELMPLHMLRDATTENSEHPLSPAFNWETLPEKVQLDNHLDRALTKFHNDFPGLALTHRDIAESAHIGGIVEHFSNRIMKHVLGELPHFNHQDILHSADRLRNQHEYQDNANYLGRAFPRHLYPDHATEWHDEIGDEETRHGPIHQVRFYQPDDPERY